MKEKLTELIKQAKYCTEEELAEYLISAGLVLPVEPGREMGQDMAERCYRNGEEAMREKVISYLRDQKGITMGAIRSTLSDAIEKVRKL